MIKVYFDGICGHCSKEINHYKQIAPANKFHWIDVAASPDAMVEYNITQSEALLFLHVVDTQGEIHVGADAFSVIWKNLPNWRLIGHVISLPVIRFFTKHIYIWFAKRRFNGYRHCQLASKEFSRN